MVPDDWTTKRLKNITESVSDGIHTTPEYVQQSDYYFINGNNLRDGEIVITQNTKHVSKEEYMRYRKALNAQTILMSINGTIGNLAYYNNENIILGKSAAYINLCKDVNRTFVYYVLSSSQVNNYFKSELTGTTINNLSLKSIRNTVIHLPPINEQDKITQIISTWDKAIETTKKLIGNSKAQKKALMQQLFSDTGPSAGPHTQKTKLQIDKLTSIYDGTHATPHYVKEGVPFYSVEHVTRNNFSETKYISEAVFTKENLRVKLEKGDILMTRIGDIGTPKYLDWDVRASFYVSLALIKQGTAFNSLFLAYYIQSEAFQRELWKKTIHVAFPKKINLRDLGKCVVSLPQIEAQNQIAKTLSSMDQIIKAQEQKLACLNNEKKFLMQQLLTGKRRVKVGHVKATKAVA
jgi:type I restriction enzyme, S subunit